MIIFYILTTLSLDNVWTSLGENCCWLLLELKGLTRFAAVVTKQVTCFCCPFYHWLVDNIKFTHAE